MKSFLIILLITLGIKPVIGQEIISGSIMDKENTPLPFALISISKKDSTVRYVASKIADSLGKFTVEVPKKGQYIVRASAVGYTNQEIALNWGQPVMIQLERDAHQLNDVSVVAKKPLVERKVDRIVMNVDNNPLAAGKSSMDAIGLAPGVMVRDGQISINGLTGTRVMVNGKLLQLTGSDLTNYLNSLRSDEIQSIEIIAHPPAEYDAAGSGGLVNIVLKKQTSLGIYGSVYGNFSKGKYPETSEGTQLNFKKGKLGLFANYSYNWEKGFNKIDQIRDFPGNGKYTAKNRGVNIDQDQRLHAGASFDFTDKQYIALDYTGSFSKSREKFVANSFIDFPQDPGKNSVSEGVFPSTYNSNYNDFGLNYHLTTDTLGSQFELLSDYTLNHSSSNNNAANTFYNADNQFVRDTGFRNMTPSAAKIFTADAKYKMVFKNAGIFSFGSKVSITNIHNLAEFEYLKEDEWIKHPEQNFIYDYKENILAGYVNYSGKILNTDVQLGLRGENTDLTGTLKDTAGTARNPKNYFGLFPSVYLKRGLDKEGDNSISVSYNRRLNRPGFSSLNPHVSYIDNYTSGRGNPYLTPEYNNAYEINYTLHNKYIFTATYTNSTDVINDAILPETDNPERLTQQPINSGSTKIWMVSAYIPVKITKWWTTQNTIQLSNQHAIAEAFDLQKNIGMLQSNQIFTLGNGYSISASSYYLNSVIFANAILHHLFNTDIALQKKFFKDKLTVKLAGNDVFGTSKVFGTFHYDDFNMDFSQLRQTQKVTLGVTYNFNLGKAFSAKKLESSNADEKNRL